jgi:hypothetical protein
MRDCCEWSGVTDVYLSEAEQEAIAVLADYLPEPGTRCPTCHRRVNKPRQTDSPDTREMRIKLPTERMEWAEEAFDALQQVVGADPYSYPRGAILEAMLVIAGQQREQLKAYFEGSE